MSTVKAVGIAAIVALCGLTTRPASAGRPDSWITTRARIALLTTDGAGRTAVKVDTERGHVTLHGKVNSEAQRDAAASAVGSLDGVKSVRNLVQVVPEASHDAVNASDADVKRTVEAMLNSHESLGGVKVESVDKGIVLLEGRSTTLALELEAIELVYECAGVRQVASQIQTREP